MLVFLEGDGKVHGEAPRRNQRAALSDRTNVQAGQVTRVEIKGKPPLQINRPLTRRFHAQLLSNDDKKNNVVIALDNFVSTLISYEVLDFKTWS